MFTVEYYWEKVFDTWGEAFDFAIEIGPVYGVYPQVVPIKQET